MAAAGKRGGADFAALRRELADGKIRPVYLLAGEDSLRAEGVVDWLRRTLLGDAGSAFNYHVYDGDDAGLDRVIQQALSYPMMCPHQVLWVKRADQLMNDPTAEPAFQRYLEQPAGETVLVLTADKVDGRKAWVKACKAAGCLFDMAPPSGRDLVDWTVRRARDKGLRLSREPAELLVELVGDDPAAIDGELEKVALIAAESQEQLDDAQLREVIMSQRSVDPFLLVRCLGPGHVREGLNTYHRFLSEGRSAFELAPLMIWRIKQVAQVAALRAEGVSEREVPSALGISPYAARQAVATASDWGSEGVERALAACQRCEAAMKSSPLGAESILERAILEICRD